MSPPIQGSEMPSSLHGAGHRLHVIEKFCVSAAGFGAKNQTMKLPPIQGSETPSSHQGAGCNPIKNVVLKKTKLVLKKTKLVLNLLTVCYVN